MHTVILLECFSAVLKEVKLKMKCTPEPPPNNSKQQSVYFQAHEKQNKQKETAEISNSRLSNLYSVIFFHTSVSK